MNFNNRDFNNRDFNNRDFMTKTPYISKHSLAILAFFESGFHDFIFTRLNRNFPGHTQSVYLPGEDPETNAERVWRCISSIFAAFPVDLSDYIVKIEINSDDTYMEFVKNAFKRKQLNTLLKGCMSEFIYFLKKWSNMVFIKDIRAEDTKQLAMNCYYMHYATRCLLSIGYYPDILASIAWMTSNCVMGRKYYGFDWWTLERNIVKINAINNSNDATIIVKMKMYDVFPLTDEVPEDPPIIPWIDFKPEEDKPRYPSLDALT